MSGKSPIIIGVAGGSGSGKTTVSQAILSRVGRERIAYIQHDAYYRDLTHLNPEERTRVNYDHPDSLENDLLIRQLDELIAGRAVDIPIYDFTIHNRSDETERVQPHPVVLVEGILIFADKDLRDRMDVKIYVDADADLRVVRRLLRDVAERGRAPQSVIDQYLNFVRPMHLEFVEPSKRYADIIIPRGGMNAVAIDMVVSRVEYLLTTHDKTDGVASVADDSALP